MYWVEYQICIHGWKSTYFKRFIDSEEQVIAVSSPYETGKHIL
jgi:hypothetical protein